MRLLDLFEQSRQYLYHGTMLINALSVLKHGRINGQIDSYGKPEGVSTSRNYAVAYRFCGYNAYEEEPYPVVFVIDWDRLRLKGFKNEPYDWEGMEEERGLPATREMEEVIHGNIPLEFIVSINVKMTDLDAAVNDDDWKNEWSKLFQLSFEEIEERVMALAKHPLLNRIVPRNWR